MKVTDKKIKLIYNPHSGNRSFKNMLHDCIVIFQKAGYETHVFSSVEPGDIEKHIAGMPVGYYDAFAISGGDGTISIAVNALLSGGHDIPLLFIPSGTANDFASTLKIPKDARKAAALIKNDPIPCDVGIVNGRYFLNVCAVGFLADISQIVDKGLKDSLGNLAYYVTGLGKLADLKPTSVRIRNSRGDTFEDSIYLFLALNSSRAGGLSNLSPNAKVDDGLFDFIAVRAVALIDFAKILMKLLSGEHLSDSNVIYFQDHNVKIEALSNERNNVKTDVVNEHANVKTDVDGERAKIKTNVVSERDNAKTGIVSERNNVKTDVDGERGPSLPLVIENIRHAIRVFAP